MHIGMFNLSCDKFRFQHVVELSYIATHICCAEFVLIGILPMAWWSVLVFVCVRTIDQSMSGILGMTQWCS